MFFDNNLYFVGGPAINNMPPTPGSYRQQQQKRLAQDSLAIGPYPGQHFSGNPPMAYPPGTISPEFLPLYQRDLQGSDKTTAPNQPSAVGHHQQYGSWVPVPSQEQIWPMTSAGPGHAVDSHYYARPQAPQAQPTTSQADFSQVAQPANPQPANPQWAFQQATVQSAALALEAIPHQMTQQPHHQRQAQHQPQAQHQLLAQHQELAQHQPPAQHQPLAQHQPQAPPLTFEQSIAAFRPVPEPHPEPIPRPGAGRRKKPQRFWPPQHADQFLKRRYEMLQTADNRVDIAEKKLAKNNKPSQTVHLQTILLRNMQEREELWTQCQRVERGEVAVELPLPEAEAKTRRLCDSWNEGWKRLQEREASLKTEHPHAVGDDGEIDLKRLGKKDQQGLQTMINWSDHRWLAVCDAFETLRAALYRATGVSVDGTKAFLTLLHELGYYAVWAVYYFADPTPANIEFRNRFLNPDPSTWGLDDGLDPIQPAQPVVQQHQQGQLEYGQPGYGLSAEPPHTNYEPGIGLDQPASIDPQLLHAQYQQQLQTQPGTGLDQPASIDPQLLHAQYQQQLQTQPGTWVSQTPSIDPQLLYAQDQQQPQTQPGTWVSQTPSIDPQLLHAQDQQQPQTQQAPVPEGNPAEQHAITVDAVPADINVYIQPQEQDDLREITYEEAMAEIDGYYPDPQPEQLQAQEAAIEQTIRDMEAQGMVMADEEFAAISGSVGPNGEHQPPPVQEAATNEQMDSSANTEDQDAPHETDPEHQEEQSKNGGDVKMANCDDSSSSSDEDYFDHTNGPEFEYVPRRFVDGRF